MKKHIFLDEELLSEVSNTLTQILGAEKVQGFSQNDLVVHALKQLLCKPLPKPDSGSGEVQELHCLNRILYQGSNWCVTNPPKMVQLKTLEICKVCKQRRLGLTEKTLSPSPVESEPQPLAAPPQPQPQKTGYTGVPSKHYTTIYCPAGGLYVPLSKCDLCKRDAFNVYDVCQKQKHPELRIPQKENQT